MNKIKTKNKRAFTLTELLIVVIVIGVLSAVTLPKFNRVIENRKVTEAEEMMSAVRMEQERRCTLDQNYTTNFSNLSDVIASANTKNYTYSLQSQGISARSASGDYTLKILSYEDGSYCCTGTGCKKLNKNYPDCATLSFPTSNCAGTEGGTGEPGTDPGETPECADGEVQGSQACNGCGVQTTQKCVNGKWTNVLGTCSKTAEECTPKPQCPTKPADVVKQCECGTVTATHKCDASTNYTWVQEAFPACPTKPADVTETCSDGKTVRTKTYTCVNNTWTLGNWDKECPEEKDCSDYDYKYEHKAECCPSAPKDDTACWILSGVWGGQTKFTGTFQVSSFGSGSYISPSSNSASVTTHCLNNNSYKEIYPVGRTRCSGFDGNYTGGYNSLKGKPCDYESLPEGDKRCYVEEMSHSLSSFASYDTECTTKTGTDCSCTVSSWEGFECSPVYEKNGW